MRRLAAMRERLIDRFWQFEISTFDNAPDCIRAIQANVQRTLLVSLDHDLVTPPAPNGAAVDPGTGRDVVEFLSGIAPAFPLIVHTSNNIAGDGVEFRLAECGWQVHRVVPYGDLAWIDECWFVKARQLLTAAATSVDVHGARQETGLLP